MDKRLSDKNSYISANSLPKELKILNVILLSWKNWKNGFTQIGHI